MAHGLNLLIKREIDCNNQKSSPTTKSPLVINNCTMDSLRTSPMMASSSVAVSSAPIITAAPPTKLGSRRIFTPQFKLQVLDSYRNDSDCKGNQRATARKYGIHRRQIQKWLQCEGNLRSSVFNNGGNNGANSNNNNSSSYNHNNNNNQTGVIVNKNIISNNIATATRPQQQLQYHHHIPSSAGFVPPALLHYHHHHVEVPSLPTYTSTPTISPHLYYPHPPEPQPEYVYENLPYPDQYEHPPIYVELNESAPIDLSVQKPKVEHIHDGPSSSNNLLKTPQPQVAQVKVLTELKTVQNQNSEAWDLSCRKRKPSADESNLPSPPKAVKLFKPYLLGDDDDESSSSTSKKDEPTPETADQVDPIIWSNHSNRPTSSSCKREYNFFPSPTYQGAPTTPPIGYELTATTTSYWTAPQGSPVSGYESAASVSSNISDSSDHIYPTAHYTFDHSATSRFQYRRDVQKWLQNDDHFRPLVISN